MKPMSLPRPASPRALVADLRAFARGRSRVQWTAATFAVLMPVIIIFGFIKDTRTNIAPGEQIIYAETWRADRSDAEIQADQQRRETERQAAAAARQREFQKIENAFGM